MWHRVLIAAIVLLAGLSGASRAANAGADCSGVYVGTVGGAPVVVEIGASLDGTYFYAKHAVGIAFALTMTNGRISIRERTSGQAYGAAPAGPRWQLSQAGKKLAGTWRSADGRNAYAVALTRIGDAAKPADERLLFAPLTYRELLREPLTATPLSVAGAFPATTLTDGRTNVSTVAFSSALPNAARVNRLLREDLDEHRSEAIDCLTNANENGLGGEYKETVHVAYASSRVVSIDERAEFFCGGAHPDEDVFPITIDVSDATNVDWHNAVSSAALVKKSYLRHLTDGPHSRDPGCATPDVTAEMSAFAFEIVPRGMLLHALLPHVIAACAADVVVPGFEARAFLRPAHRKLVP